VASKKTESKRVGTTIFTIFVSFAGLAVLPATEEEEAAEEDETVGVEDVEVKGRDVAMTVIGDPLGVLDELGDEDLEVRD
jgi:hypothetical protein